MRRFIVHRLDAYIDRVILSQDPYERTPSLVRIACFINCKLDPDQKYADGA